SDVRMDYVLAEGAQLISMLSVADLQQKLETLRGRARTAFTEIGYAADDLRFDFAVDARYHGQGYELRVTVEAARMEIDGQAYLADRFHEEHARQYGHAFKERDVEAISFRMSAVHARSGGGASLIGMSTPAPTGDRDVLMGGAVRSYPIVARNALPATHDGAGPVIIVEPSSSTLVPPGWRVTAEASGVLRLTKEGARP
ncbi:MAG: hypothetical protein ACKVH0_22020, partial [Alphaproteobacteria bacterium]